jgi:hypothetical protein
MLVEAKGGRCEIEHCARKEEIVLHSDQGFGSRIAADDP